MLTDSYGRFNAQRLRQGGDLEASFVLTFMIREMFDDLVAEIYFLSSEEGGRRSGVASGYRPQHDFQHPKGWHNDASHHYPDRNSVEPGETVKAIISLLVPERNSGRLYVGMPFTIYEGARLVGRGTIKEILNPTLKRPS